MERIACKRVLRTVGIIGECEDGSRRSDSMLWHSMQYNLMQCNTMELHAICSATLCIVSIEMHLNGTYGEAVFLIKNSTRTSLFPSDSNTFHWNVCLFFSYVLNAPSNFPSVQLSDLIFLPLSRVYSHSYSLSLLLTDWLTACLIKWLTDHTCIMDDWYTAS